VDGLIGKAGKRASVALLIVAAAAICFFSSGDALRSRLTGALKARHTAFGWPVRVSLVAGDGTSGLADAPSSAARFADPFGLAIDRAGNLFVADAGDNNRIRKIAPDGAVSTFAGGREGFADGVAANAAFNTPSALAIDHDGNLFVADTGNNAIRKISQQGMVTTLAGSGEAGYRDGKAGQAQFNGPVGVAVDQAGNVYVADTYNDRIRKIAANGDVTTIAGGAGPGYQDGPAASSLFDTPCALAVDAKGVIFIADTRNGAIRRLTPDGQVTTLAATPADGAESALLRRPLGLALTADGFLYVGDTARGRILQLAPNGELRGLTGIGIDIEIGDDKAVRFERPSAIALDRDGTLYVADAVKRVVRKVAPQDAANVRAAAPPSGPPAAAKLADFPWPLKPQHEWHEVVGTMGEVRGSYDGESRDHFHNGLDVQGTMGVPVLAVADEKVSSPLPNWSYGGLGEGLSIDSMTYIHMRVGRTIRDAAIDPARFTLLDGANGKPARVRVKRGARFKVGDTLGTINRMFHVHLVYGPDGGESNPLALPFSGFTDSMAPHIAGIALFDQAGQRLVAKRGKRLLVARGAGPLAIVVDAYDQNDGNLARRRLGLYKAGYQILHADGTSAPGFEQPLVNIEFNRLPPDRESVKLAYAGSSGITVYGNAVTRFLYQVTNTVRDGRAKTGSWQPADLPPGDYLIRILAADYVGNEAKQGRDLAITIE
jgi:sugar lactone lactonase YvrE